MSCDKVEVVYPPQTTNNFSEVGSNKMIRALSAIAMEMQKFHAGTTGSCQNFGGNQELSDKLSICKTNLRLKKEQIKHLKENLRKAYIVAKTVMSANQNMTLTFRNDMNCARSECTDLTEQNKINIETMKLLKTENQSLLEKLNHLDNFIELGYQELQRIRNFTAGNHSPTVIKLKEIMLSCGQYYADYCNERESRLQIEQKNRFLNNKISIMRTNLEAVMEQVKNLRFEINKLRKENNSLKCKRFKKNENNAISVFSDERICQQNSTNRNDLNETLTISNTDDGQLDLTSHLALVRNLLSDQDIMLKELKRLSGEVKSSCCTNSATEFVKYK